MKFAALQKSVLRSVLASVDSCETMWRERSERPFVPQGRSLRSLYVRCVSWISFLDPRDTPHGILHHLILLRRIRWCRILPSLLLGSASRPASFTVPRPIRRLNRRASSAQSTPHGPSSRLGGRARGGASTAKLRFAANRSAEPSFSSIC